MEFMDSIEFWNSVYASGEVQIPSDDAPVLNAALQHFGDVRGKRLLDIGCGRGEISVFFASKGAHVVSVDTSPTAIANQKNFCSRHQIPNITPVQLSAMEIESAGSFDFVMGSMILHHIEPFAVFAEVMRRSLVSGGKAFFYENNAYSDLLIWFRKHVVGKLWVPKTSDNEEFPLTPAEITILRKHFGVQVEYPELLFFRLISMCLLRGIFPEPFRRMDEFFYQFESMRKYSYRQYVILTQSK